MAPAWEPWSSLDTMCGGFLSLAAQLTHTLGHRIIGDV